MQGLAISDVPKLWTLARAGLYPAVRSRYAMATLELDARGAGTPLSPMMQRPWLEDLSVVLLYDFGQHVSYISQPVAEAWGAAHEEIWAYAFHNLKTLPRPHWEVRRDGVCQLTSEAGYEETFVLLDEVRARLKFSSHAVLALPNRGAMLAADARDATSLGALIEAARQQLQDKPWPLSGTLIQRNRNGWQRWDPPGAHSAPARTLETLSLAHSYREQKAALDRLHESTGLELFTASFALRDEEDPSRLRSYCVWTEGVDSLLPKTDYLIFNRGAGGLHPERLAIPWPMLEQLCGQYLEMTSETPIRFRARQFPTQDEWAAVHRTATGA
jgi:hypothetical protein